MAAMAAMTGDGNYRRTAKPPQQNLVQQTVVVLTAVAVTAALVTVPATAGDYAHTCATSDGQFVFNDGGLYRSGQGAGGPAQREIAYKVISTMPLSQNSGACESKAGAGGARYAWTGQSYLLTFLVDGEQFKRTAFCELAASGLPAALNCDRDVIEHTWSARIANRALAKPVRIDPEAEDRARAASTIWAHDGGEVRLFADGAFRRIIVERPSTSMRRAGLSKGDVLFHGTRTGTTMNGQSYASSALCGPHAVPVSGTVGSDQTSFTLSGAFPDRDGNCSVSRLTPRQLSFQFLRR